MTADPLFLHPLSGEGDFRTFLGGECEGELGLPLLSLGGELEECCLCLLSSPLSLSFMVVGDLERVLLRGLFLSGDLKRGEEV